MRWGSFASHHGGRAGGPSSPGEDKAGDAAEGSEFGLRLRNKMGGRVETSSGLQAFSFRLVRREDRPDFVRAGSFLGSQNLPRWRKELQAQLRERLLYATQIRITEQPNMDQCRVKIVDVPPHLVKARLDRHDGAVGLEKRAPERTKHRGER